MTKSAPTSESPDRIESGLLRRINERRLFEVLQQQGPASRASLTRLSGLTAPTVSKAVESLLARGFVEEIDPVEPALGRPGKLVRLATESAIVLGVVIDVTSCSVVTTGLDGRVTDEQTSRFATPPDYPALLDTIEAEIRAAVGASFDQLRGIGISVPGLVNDRLGEIVFSPNLHLLDKRNPARDLADRLARTIRHPGSTDVAPEAFLICAMARYQRTNGPGVARSVDPNGAWHAPRPASNTPPPQRDWTR